MVTTGSTKEYLDPVRYISNESSGKQGYEIALALSKLGVKTTLIAGPSSINFSKDVKVKNVTSAKEMLEKVKNSLPVDIAICAAAVSDFKPRTIAKNKLRKSKDILDVVRLEKNPDILEFIGKNNKNRPRIVVGFSAETENLISNSYQKLKEKYCDIIIANDVSKKNTGFNSEYNKVSIINKKGKVESIPKNKKSYIASIIAKKIIDKFLVDDKTFN